MRNLTLTKIISRAVQALLLGWAMVSAHAFAGFLHPIAENSTSGEVSREIQATRPTVSAPSAMQALKSADSAALRALSQDSRTLQTGSLPLSGPRASVPAVDGVAERKISRFTVPVFDLQGKSRQEVAVFVQKALAMKLPQREYALSHRGQDSYIQWQGVIHHQPHQVIRSKEKPTLAKTVPIPHLWSEALLQIQAQRMEALFHILAGDTTIAVSELWELANRTDNLTRFRDALFTGIAAQRDKLEHLAWMAYTLAVRTGAEKESYYLGLLWTQLDLFSQERYVDLVLGEMRTDSWRSLAPTAAHDRALYVWAKLHPKEMDEVEKRMLGGETKERARLLRLLRTEKYSDAWEAELKTLTQAPYPAVRQNAQVALARNLASQERYIEAQDVYQQTKRERTNKLDLLLEMAYIDYRLGQFQASIGKSVGLTSTFFRYGFVPDVYFLEANARKAVCDFGGAELALKRFQQTYKPEMQALESFIAAAKNQGADAYYQHAIQAFGSSTPFKYQRYLLHLPELHTSQKLISSWKDEWAQLDRMTADPYRRPARADAWEQLARDFRAFEADRKHLLTAGAEKILRAETHYMLNRLYKLFSQLELMNLDITTQASAEYSKQAALNYPLLEARSGEFDSDHILWSFHTEVWEDELEFLRARNSTRCAAAPAKLADTN